MADLTYKVSVDINNALQALGSFEKKLLGLKSAVAGIGLLSFARNAFQVADAMSDLSNSTGLAVQQIINLQYAVEAAGGRLDQVNQAVLRFSLSIDEAAQGSEKLQAAFSEVGVSLEELGSLSEEQLLQEVAKGFLEIEDRSRAAGVANDLFGKSIRGIDIKKFSQEILDGKSKYTDYAEAVTKAATLQGKLDRALIDLRIAFLSAIEPLVTFVENLKASEGGIAQFTFLIKALTVAISILAGGALFRSIAALVGTVGRMVTGFKRLSAAGRAAKDVKILGGSMQEAAKHAQKAADAIKDKWASNSPLMNALRGAAMLLGSVLGLGSGLGAIGAFSDDTGSKESSDAAKAAAEDELKTQREVINALREKIATIKEVGKTYAEENHDIINTINNEAKYLKMTANEAEIQKTLDEFYKRTAKAIGDLQAQKAKLTDKDKEQKKAIDETIASISEQARKDAARLVAAIQNRQKETEAINARNRAIEFGEQIRQDTQSIEDLKQEILMLGMTKEQRDKLQRAYLNEKALKERLKAIDVEAAKVGKDATQEQIDDWERRRQAAIKFYTELGLLQEEQASKEKDYKTVVINALDAIAQKYSTVNMIQEGITMTWNRISDAIDTFIQTGKGSFKDLATSIIADLTAMIAKALVFQAIMSVLSTIPGVGPLLKASGMLTPKASGGPVSGKTPYLVGERGPELFVPNNSGNIVPNNRLNNAQVAAPVTNNYITNNINALDSKSVAQVFAENRKALLGSVSMAQKELPYGMA